MSVCGAQWRVIGTRFSSGLITYVQNSGGFWAGGNSAAFEVNCHIKQRSGAVVWRCSLVQRDGRNRSGERPTSRADPGTVSRYLLPCVLPPYAVIPKDRQACAIWPHFGFPGHILGIQTMPPPRLSLPSVLSPSVLSLHLHFIPA